MMKLSLEQERVKELLSETITRLCVSGLTFTTEFTIQALVGITIDKTDVLLFNINETVAPTTAVSKTKQSAVKEHSVSSAIAGTRTGTDNVHRGPASKVTSLKVPTPLHLKRTRTSTGAIGQNSTIIRSPTASLRDVNKEVGSSIPTKKYVKILPKEPIGASEKTPDVVNDSHIIVTMPKMGRKKSGSDKTVITDARPSTLTTRLNISEPGETSETINGSNPFPISGDSRRRFSDGGVSGSDAISVGGVSDGRLEIVVKEEPVDPDFIHSSFEESNLLPGFTLADCSQRSNDRSCSGEQGDADAQEEHAGDMDAHEMEEYDAFVRDFSVNDQQQQQQKQQQTPCDTLEENVEEKYTVTVEPKSDGRRRHRGAAPKPETDERLKRSAAAGATGDNSRRSDAQIRRRSGLAYVNGKGEYVSGSGREMKPQNCSRCKLKCSEKLSDADRKEIFKRFWEMGPQQVNFVQSYVREVPVQFLTLGHQSRRSRTLQYFLPAGHEKVKVCRDMFLHTLNLSVNTLYTKLAKV